MINSQVYETLVKCMTSAAHLELTLQNGEQVGRFRVHDIIAPTEKLRFDESVVRGIVWPEHGPQLDRSIPLSDIVSVQDEHLLPYIPVPEFFNRNPLPDGWVKVA